RLHNRRPHPRGTRDFSRVEDVRDLDRDGGHESCARGRGKTLAEPDKPTGIRLSLFFGRYSLVLLPTLPSGCALQGTRDKGKGTRQKNPGLQANAGNWKLET